MNEPVPRPTYYRAGRSRRVALGAMLAVGLLAGLAGVAFGTDLLGQDDGTAGGDPTNGAGAGGPVTLADGAPIVSSGNERADDPPESSLDSVVVVGDSITQGSTDELRYTLTAQGFTDVTVDGLASRRIDVGNGTSEPLNGIATIYQLLAEGADPDVWVIALGTNDVGQYERERYVELVDEVLAMLPEDAAVVWVDVFRPQYLDQTGVFNEVLRERIDDRDGDAVVASWFEVASAPDETVLQRDGLHPNDDGQAVFAAIVAEAIAEID